MKQPALGQEQNPPTHRSNFGVKLQEKCKSATAECEFICSGASDMKRETVQGFLSEKLKAAKR